MIERFLEGLLKLFRIKGFVLGGRAASSGVSFIEGFGVVGRRVNDA